MAESTPRSSLSPDETEAFTILALRYLDCACSVEEIAQLRGAVAGSAVYRMLFVQVCRMQGQLHEIYAPKRAALEQNQEAARLSAHASTAQTAGAATGGTQRTAPSDPRSPARSSQQERQAEFPIEQDSPPDHPLEDPGAETVNRELTGEDTIHPEPKAPEKKS
jgi:hypothetical protein